MSDVVMRAVGLSKTLQLPSGSSQALVHFSAEFVAGRRYAITGPSGCGKSTLLYLLGLLDEPTTGEIFLMNESAKDLDVDALAALRNRYLGFVFQFHFLLPELTVEENVMLPALKAGMEPKAAQARALELLAAVGLGAKAGRFAFQLSGGEQQRVAVARALVNNPRLVLADEPTGNLDSANSQAIFELLGHQAASLGATLVMVTHNETLAQMCDEVIALRDGKRVS